MSVQRGRSVRLVAETLAWTVLLAGLWVATLTAVNTLELAAAAVSGLLCGVLATATRTTLAAAARPRAAWAGWLARLPAAVVTDLAHLAVAVLTHPGALGGERHLDLPDEPHVRGETRRALGAIAISATPGSYVVEDDDGGLLLHALSTEATPLERAVAR